jgi:hypothetical protein
MQGERVGEAWGEGKLHYEGSLWTGILSIPKSKGR